MTSDFTMKRALCVMLFLLTLTGTSLYGQQFDLEDLLNMYEGGIKGFEKTMIQSGNTCVSKTDTIHWNYVTDTNDFAQFARKNSFITGHHHRKPIDSLAYLSLLYIPKSKISSISKEDSLWLDSTISQFLFLELVKQHVSMWGEKYSRSDETASAFYTYDSYIHAIIKTSLFGNVFLHPEVFVDRLTISLSSEEEYNILISQISKNFEYVTTWETKNKKFTHTFQNASYEVSAVKLDDGDGYGIWIQKLHESNN